MEIRIIDSTIKFGGLRREWNNCLRSSNSPTVFSTWEWLFNWWKIYGENKDLFIVTVYHDGSLIGIAPLCINPVLSFKLIRTTSLEFLGTGIVASDYLDFIINKEWEAAAVRKIFSYLARKEQHWDILRLHDIKESSILHELLPQLTKQHNLNCEPAGIRSSSSFALASNSRNMLMQLRKQTRKRFRRNLRKLRSDFDIEFDVVDDHLTLDLALERLEALHIAKFKDKKNHTSSFSFDHFRRFHRRCAHALLDAGLLYLTVLKINGEIAAVEYATQFGNTIYDYNAGYSRAYYKYSIGHCLLLLSIKTAIQRGFHTWNFSRGNARYKSHWPVSWSYNKHLLIYKKGNLSSHLLLAKSKIWNALKNQVKNYLPKAAYDKLANKYKVKLFS